MEWTSVCPRTTLERSVCFQKQIKLRENVGVLLRASGLISGRRDIDPEHPIGAASTAVVILEVQTTGK